MAKTAPVTKKPERTRKPFPIGFNAEERAGVSKRADAAGISSTAWVRQLVRRELGLGESVRGLH